VLAEHADGLATRCWLRDLHGPFAWAVRCGLAPGGWRRDASGTFAVAAGTRRSLARVARIGGTIAIRAQPLRPLAIPAARHGPPLLAAGAFAASFAGGEATIAHLAALAPQALVDRPFPGEAQSRFDLLNGWQMPDPGAPTRRGYRRARWFLRRPAAAGVLGFSARAATARLGFGRSITVRLDGQLAGRWPIDATGWTTITTGVEHVSPDRPFVCEIRLEGVPEDARDFDEYVFEIRDRAFAAAAGDRTEL
jgi:DNA segregation ATPase FtsK/SpoIIIE-like protein